MAEQADLERQFVAGWWHMQREAAETSRSKGWLDSPFSDETTEMLKASGEWEDFETYRRGTIIALIHSELSEALESLRKGDQPDDKIPEYTGCEVELADVIIRIMDFADYYGYDVRRAVTDKITFNKTRPHKHGGKEF